MLTARRIWNAAKAEFSYALSLFGAVRICHMPTFVSVEPANYCQLHCPECPIGAKAPGTPGKVGTAGKTVLSPEAFRHILSEVAPWAHTMMLFWQGEPLLNHHLPEMVQLAHEAGLYTIVSTNAQLLTTDMANALYKAGLSRIIVSIDGFTQESYNAYRVGGSLQKALDGLQHRAAQTVELQVLRLRTNEHEWAWIKRHYRELGADTLTLKTAQLYNYEHGHPLMPTDTRYARYIKGADGHYRLKKARSRSCHRLWTGCVITVSGEVLPCCYDKEHTYPLGNLLQQHLHAIWRGEKADALRRQYLHNASDIAMCRNCDY